MSTPLLSEYPGLIGQILQRAERRTQRRRRLRRLLIAPFRFFRPTLRIARISPTEVIHSHAPLQ